MRVLLKAYISALVLLLALATSVTAEAEYYTVVEGQGIKSVGFLGDNISQVEKVWGKADRIAKDDSALYPHPTFRAYEYYQRGVSFTSDEDGKILEITIFCKTYPSGSNPDAAYRAFKGKMVRGLVFEDGMMLDDVYAVYGTPKIIKDATSKSLVKAGDPYIIDRGVHGYGIFYPKLSTSFSASSVSGLVISCEMSDLRKK